MPMPSDYMGDLARGLGAEAVRMYKNNDITFPTFDGLVKLLERMVEMSNKLRTFEIETSEERRRLLDADREAKEAVMARIDGMPI